ncbi:hypothetical protein VQ7734_01124 [Vibrio quintilis]|uniref:Uncharacterized protein n=1 Tax=Vibrio quintilis TaxID=1117707 RepID=A0A1M7YS92_9VIBR|nr:hypothetical protein VQ7734_01124 [Vibrio quintilis]
MSLSVSVVWIHTGMGNKLIIRVYLVEQTYKGMDALV